MQRRVAGAQGWCWTVADAGGRRRRRRRATGQACEPARRKFWFASEAGDPGVVGRMLDVGIDRAAAVEVGGKAADAVRRCRRADRPTRRHERVRPDQCRWRAGRRRTGSRRNGRRCRSRAASPSEAGAASIGTASTRGSRRPPRPPSSAARWCTTVRSHSCRRSSASAMAECHRQRLRRLPARHGRAEAHVPPSELAVVAQSDRADDSRSGARSWWRAGAAVTSAAGVVEDERRSRCANALRGAAPVAEASRLQRYPWRSAERCPLTGRSGAMASAPDLFRIDRGTRRERDVLVLAAAIRPRPRRPTPPWRRGRQRPAPRATGSGCWLHSRRRHRSAGCDPRSPRTRARRSRPTTEKGAQVLEFLLAESDRFGALARDVGAEPSWVCTRRRQDAERQHEERDQRLEQRRAALAPRTRSAEAGHGQKSFQLPLTRANLPVPASAGRALPRRGRIGGGVALVVPSTINAPRMARRSARRRSSRARSVRTPCRATVAVEAEAPGRRAGRSAVPASRARAVRRARRRLARRSGGGRQRPRR